MSYARISKDSDVYAYPDIDFGLRCCMCRLDPCYPYASWETRSRSEMLQHLEKHRTAGHKVPDYAFNDLRSELEEEGDDCPGNMHLAMDRRKANGLG